MDKTILTKVQGNVYKAAWVRGILHCSIYGHITNITVYKMPSTEITIRDNSGSKIIDFDDEFYSNLVSYQKFYWVYPYVYEMSSNTFSFTKNGINLEIIELTIYSKNVQDILFLIEGGIYYRCDNGIEGMQITKDSLYGINDQARFRESFLWITTVFALMLSLVLAAVFIIQCLLRRKCKKISLRTESHADPSSRRPISNDYETPHVYMDLAL
ncbi:uncharacterized protein LOC111136501 [Crassostrea virginica]